MDLERLKRELADNNWLDGNAYINGEWLHKPQKFEVFDPATGEAIGKVTDCNAKDCTAAIDAAQEALAGWAALSASKRSALLMAWYVKIKNNADLLARLLTLEQGKILSEAKGEILYGASFVRWFASEAERAYGDVIPSNHPDKRMTVLKQPVGVCAAITPWNFPNAMVTRKIAPALAAGCTVVLKPSDETPYSALALAYLAEEAGIPKGVLNVVTAKNPVPIGETITSSRVVRKISFTGSTSVGKWLMEKSAPTLKRLSLELGGNAPMIIFEDADMEQAVKGTIASKFRNNGQTCICSNRILVHDAIYDEFYTRLSEQLGKMKYGSGFDNDSDFGPLINRQAVEKVNRLVGDAVEKGARLVSDEKDHASGLFYKPAILADASPEMNVFSEEIFGPVAPLYRFSSDQEAVALANDTRYGLAAYFYTNQLSRAWKVAEQLEYGMVGINETAITNAAAPFGGIKESGFGREGSRYGIEEYLDIKYVCFGIG